MISIRDEDKARLERIVSLVAIPLTERERQVQIDAQAVLKSIHDLSQEQAYPPPRIAARPIDSNERKVRDVHPGAIEVGGKCGAVWIDDGNGVRISDICGAGSYNDRRGDAWESAAQLCNL